MTSKLKCPFCGEELYDNRAVSAVASRIDIYLCVNSKCGESDKLIGTKELWQALIQSQQDLKESQQATLTNAHTALEFQKDLEIARKALGFYADSRFGKKQDDGTYALEIDKGCGVTVVYTYDPRLAKQTLEQIEHKE